MDPATLEVIDEKYECVVQALGNQENYDAIF